MSDDPRSDDLGEIEALLRSLDTDDRSLLDPPDTVWASIERELAADDLVTVDRPPSIDAGQGATVTSLTAARTRRSTWARPLLAAAAALAILAVGAVAVVSRGDDQTIVATARLEHAAGFDALGEGVTTTARLVDDGAAIEVEVDELPAPSDGEDLELWLIRPDADGGVADLVSLGVIGDDDSFAVPPGYDTEVFGVVDISVEPRDGDASHSGRSVVRGSLDV